MMACVTTPGILPDRSNKTTGKIQVVFGPMFSGKTTELVRRMKRFQIANYKCLLIKYSKDDRYSCEDVATHDRQVLPACGCEKLAELFEHALEFDVIGVDEGQFFPDIVDFCEVMANHGKTIIVAALDGTFQRKEFGDILKLVPLAESVIKLTAVCMQCYGEASFTKRKGSEKEVEVIGGAEKYLAVCRACYHGPDRTSPMCSPSSKKNTNPVPPSADKIANVGRRLFGTPLINTMDLSS